MKIGSYPKVYALGHRMVSGIFDGLYVVQEKLDGSQISFGFVNGELQVRSKGKEIDLNNPEKMFLPAIAYIDSIVWSLTSNFVYRGEYLKQPKHNTLTYGRIPNNHIMLFDIEDCFGNPLGRQLLKDHAEKLGFEVIPQLGTFGGTTLNIDELNEFLKKESVLGSEKVEGVVIKNYEKMTPDGKYMMAKYVSERFKERHNSDWKDRHPNQKDMVSLIVSNLKTEARYYKALHYCRDEGLLLHEPKDIAVLIKKIHQDIEEEEQDYIKDQLYKKFSKDIKKGVIAGFPEWYKAYLVKETYSEDDPMKKIAEVNL